MSLSLYRGLQKWGVPRGGPHPLPVQTPCRQTQRLKVKPSLIMDDLWALGWSLFLDNCAEHILMIMIDSVACQHYLGYKSGSVPLHYSQIQSIILTVHMWPATAKDMKYPCRTIPIDLFTVFQWKSNGFRVRWFLASAKSLRFQSVPHKVKRDWRKIKIKMSKRKPSNRRFSS